MAALRVAVCNLHIPFVRGGGERHGERLVRALAAEGLEAELVALPFRWYPPTEIVANMLAWRLLDLTESAGQRIDLAIGLRFPAYLVRHPRKVVWVVHQHRAAYELWGGLYGDLAEVEHGARVRDLVRTADTLAFDEAQRVFANSRTVAERLLRYNGIRAEPLYHPPPLADRLRVGPYGDYILCPSRLEPAKRQELLIEAMARVRTAARCIIVGDGSHTAQLTTLAARLGLGARVTFAGAVSDAALVDLYAGARAVYFGPYDEDYGYVTLEALLAARPVITLTDSGGPLEFVSDGVDGLVVAPDARRIAAAIDLLFAEPDLAMRLGRTGRERFRDRGISWRRVVATLTS